MIYTKFSRLAFTHTLIIFFLTCMLASIARAELVQVEYPSANGQKTVSASKEMFISPKGDIAVYLSAGVDRILKARLLTSNGSVFAEAKSSLLGANDKILVNGVSYYGTVLKLPAPTSGDFTLVAEILNSDGSVVLQSDRYNLQVDVTSPVIGGEIVRTNGGYNYPVSVLAPLAWGEDAGGTVTVSGLADKNSGIDKVEFFAIDTNGVRRAVQSLLNVEAASATVKITDITSTSITPYDRQTYTMGFRVFDKAGNYTEKTIPIAVDRKTPEYVRVEVFDLQSNSWIAYAPKMTVYANPVKIRYVRKKVDHTNFNGTLFGWGDSIYNSQDAEFIYFTTDLEYPKNSINYFVFQNKAGLASVQYYSNFTFTLAPGVEGGPVPIGLTYQIQGRDWTNSDTIRESKPFAVSSVKISTEPRGYNQIAGVNGVTCAIPAGQKECILNPNIKISSDRGYVPYPYFVSRDDGTFSAYGGYLYTYWDFNAPKVTGIRVDFAVREVVATVVDDDRMLNWQHYMWDTQEFRMILEASGKKAITSPFSVVDLDYKTREVRFKLGKISNGFYRVGVEAEDTYGNVGNAFVTDNTFIDSNAPTITIAAKAAIASLDEILITINDDEDPTPSIQRIALKGGPTSTSVDLAWRSVSSGKYLLEYPIIFPSENENEVYSLEVTATDKYGNVAIQSKAFAYKPRTVGIVKHPDGVVRIPAINHIFNRNDGTEVIDSAPLTLNDGSVVAGSYDLIASLRGDAVGSLVVAGVLIEPGATIVVGKINFSNTQGRISIPVKSGAEGVIGSNNLILSTSAPNAPIVSTNIRTWMPAPIVSLTSGPIVQAMTDIAAKIELPATSVCKITSSEVEARESDALLSPMCLLEWTEVPSGLAVTVDRTDGVTKSFLKGRALESGAHKISYSISIFNKGKEKVVLHQGEKELLVEPATGSSSFQQSLSKRSVTRALDNVSLTMTQLSGPTCSITGDEAAAKNAGMSGGALKCLIEFSVIPKDLDIKALDPLELTGVFTRSGQHPLRWTASVYDTTGKKITLEEGQSVIQVIEPPVTTKLTVSVNESSSVEATPVEDFPAAWEKKTYSVLSNPSQGSVVATPTGFTYTPKAGYVGSDEFRYRVQDVSGMSAEAIAVVNVAKFNYAPTWTGVTIQAREGQVSDQVDPEVHDINLWDSHTFKILTNPAHGTVRVFYGRMEYTPNPGFYGEDSFTFSATDQEGLSVEGEGKVTVTQFNFAPTAITPSTVKVYAGIGGTADLKVIDPNNWGSHTLQVVKQPAHGHVTVEGMSITYKTDGQAETSVQIRAIDQDGLYVDQDIVLKLVPAWEMFKDREVKPTSVAPSIPAVRHQMTTRLGAFALRIPDQEVIQALGGEIIAIVTPDSKVGVTLEHRELSQGIGMRLVPAKLSAELLEARLGGLDVGVDGQAIVYLSRADMTGPVYSVPVTVWSPEGTLTADSWEILQASGRTQISFSPSNGACSIMTSEVVAKTKNALQDRACYVTWTKTPEEWRNASTLANLLMDAGGSSLGNQAIEASAYVFDTNGVKYKVASFTRDLKILPVADQIRFALKPAPVEAYQKVQELSLSLRHTDGPVCDATANEGVAKKTAQQWSSRPSCLIRWMQMPEGMAQQRNTVMPLAEGTMSLLGANNISWKASMFTPSGQEIDIGYGEHSVNVVEPPAVEIDMPASNLVKEGLYSVSQLGGYVGSASVTAIAASLDVAINRADALIERSTIPSYGRSQRFTRYIEGAEAPLWSVTPYSIDVGYTALPNMRSTKTASLLAVPHDKILPVILNDERTVLDTVSLPIRVAIKDTRYMEDAYRLSSMGDWDIRLLSTTAGVNYEPMTNWEPIDENGEVEFEVDLQSLTNKAVRIIAEARVRSPVPEYELIRESGSPMVLSVLNGDSLDGSIQALRVIGPAPLRSSFYAVTNDRYQAGDIGEVRWEMSKDGGVSWEGVEANAKLPQRLSMIFQRGTYLLRAELTNRHSGAKSMTPTVEVIAYVVPVARLKGPANVFIGDSGTFKLTDLKGNTLDTTGMVVEWSEDRGKTWVAGDGSYRLGRNSADRVYLTARLKYSDSPEDKRVYKTLRAGVAFRPVRPPRVQIIGPRRPEVGKEATWVANLMMPYPKMDMTMDGEFILPDGTVVDSTEVKYTPTREDMDKEESYISVRSWINGYEDRGGLGLTQHRLIFWSYDWPEWKINTKYSAKYAPADLTMTARSLGLFREFEGLTIEWDIPPYAGLQMIKDTNQTSRIVRLTEPGIYTFGAHISDSRGNYSYAETEMEFLEPIPWDVKLSWSGDNDANRAPLGVLIRPSITGGHPKDQILSKTFSLNGETLSSSGDYGRATLEKEGVYTVKLDVASAMGHTAAGEVDIPVARNKPPVCKLEVVVGRTSWLAKAVCTDEDGRMAKNLWFINGEQQALSANSISVPMWRYPNGEPVITLVGIDNSGAESPPVSNK
ncbi:MULTISPECIES: Ig-like domain-containing protein [Pseudomonas]|uniref:Ig-like domain-containing protein n=1 Tax=Pseudomonas TaxID=286 RepID=UPI001ABFCC41|nr:Ig-like domain-containing protein [Pseudomonas floridensis]MEE4126682.1 Ig-like domain-containing protein [Pseudomonas viridiflava]MEE4911855.1 Ig-like domain-containing protein [Pseudomonas alliivorans]